MSIALISSLVEAPTQKVSLPSHPDNRGDSSTYQQEEESVAQAQSQADKPVAKKEPAGKTDSLAQTDPAEAVKDDASTESANVTALMSETQVHEPAVAVPPVGQFMPLAQQTTATVAGAVSESVSVAAMGGGPSKALGADALNPMLAKDDGAVRANMATMANLSLAQGHRLPQPQGSAQAPLVHQQAVSSVPTTVSAFKGEQFVPLNAMEHSLVQPRTATTPASSLSEWRMEPLAKPAADIGMLQTEATVQLHERPSVSQWGPLPLTAQASHVQHAKELLLPLRDQLRFQIDQRIQTAELQLTPPELGRIELNIRLDGDRLHIQMHAVNNQVRDALLSGLERLRTELALEHKGDIALDVGSGSEQGQSEQHARRGNAGGIAASVGEELPVDNEVERKSDRQLNLLA